MNTNKTLLAGLVGGVTSFLVGWIIYGALLMTYMQENTNQCMAIDMKDMNMILMILGNLIGGFFMAFVLSWANVTSFMSGMTKGAMIGLLYSLGHDLMMHSMTTFYSNTMAIVVAVLAATVSNALIGGVVGWMLGRGNNAAAA